MKFRSFLLSLLLLSALTLPALAVQPVQDLPGELPQSKGPEYATYDLLPEGEDGVPVPPPSAIDTDAEALDPSYDVPSSRDENGLFVSPQALYDYWNREGWPEEVGGLWSLDGTMDHVAVAIVDGDEAVMDAIRALMTDPDSLSFTSCTYSFAQLEQAMLEIEHDIKGGARCILGLGLGVRGNDFTLEGVPCIRVTITTARPDAQQWADTLTERYGDMLELEVGDFSVAQDMLGAATTGVDSPVQPGGGMDIGGTPSIGAEPSGLSESGAERSMGLLWLLLPLALALSASTALLRRRSAVVRTTSGTTEVLGGTPSRRQAEDAVRSASAVPDEAVWLSLSKKLDDGQ